MGIVKVDLHQNQLYSTKNTYNYIFAICALLYRVEKSRYYVGKWGINNELLNPQTVIRIQIKVSWFFMLINRDIISLTICNAIQPPYTPSSAVELRIRWWWAMMKPFNL